MPFAFGKCSNIYNLHYQDCSEFLNFFYFIKNRISDKYHSQLLEMQEKLKYFLAHHARKHYLNSQYKSSLASLDSDGAIMIADYKMRILPKTARETKQEFFGKRGWTLHTILVITKEDNSVEDDSVGLNVSAYDHWSTDTKQDAWFTASCFEAMFNNIEKKPKWIKIISDNGPHYHNSELMTIVAHWFDWYNIEVCEWLFLEPGKAKTTIDSHHAAVSFYLFTKIRINYNK